MALDYNKPYVPGADMFSGIEDMFKNMHDYQMKQQQLAELAKAHKAQFGLQRQQENRLQQLLGPQLQEYMDKHKQSQPGYKAEQVLQTLKMMGVPIGDMGMGGGNGGQQPNEPTQEPVVSDNQSPQQMMNDPNTGVMSRLPGNGSPSPMTGEIPAQGNPMAQPQGQPQQPPAGLNLNDPRVQMALSMNGIHMPTAKETPDQIQKRQLETNQAKLDQKSATLTNAVKTQQQGIISNTPKVKNYIDKIITAPSPANIYGVSTSPDDLAKHNSLVTAAAETYAKAKGWPNTNASINAARHILDRHTMETDSAYHKRLIDLKSTLDEDVIEAQNVLGNKGSSSPGNQSQEQKTINGVTYKKVNGEWHT